MSARDNVLDEIADKLNGGRDPVQKALVFLTFEDILAQPLPVWDVSNILQRGTFMIIDGKEKSGKSFIASDMLFACCRGLPDWFGFRINRPLRVLYISGEGS